eukprot:5790329-Prymnesium_polylepis.2
MFALPHRRRLPGVPHLPHAGGTWRRGAGRAGGGARPVYRVRWPPEAFAVLELCSLCTRSNPQASLT